VACTGRAGHAGKLRGMLWTGGLSYLRVLQAETCFEILRRELYSGDMDLVDIDLDGMLKGLRSMGVEECRAALEDTRWLLASGLADRRLLLALLSLTSAEHDKVRRDASWCIGKLAMLKLGDPRSVGTLVLLTTDHDPAVRGNAAWALGELAGLSIGDTFSIEALNILLTDPEKEVQCMAAWALGRMADKMRVTSPSSVPLLKLMLLDDSEYLRKGAQWALERIERLRAH
jgi:HEAT repeat protein